MTESNNDIDCDEHDHHVEGDMVIEGGPIELTEDEKRTLEGKCNCPRCWDGAEN